MEEEFKVRAVDFEEKSVQEVEEALLQQHEEETGIAQIERDEPIVIDESVLTGQEPVAEPTAPSFGDDDVKAYLKGKYNKEVSSLDDLFIEKQEELLPEDVSAFLKFKKETGRGLEDFYMVNRDYSKESPERLIASFLKETNPDLDAEDIEFEIQSMFSYDEDIDEASDIKKKKVAFKKELAKANKYFNEQKAKYGTPLESIGMPQQTAAKDEAYESYKQYMSTLPEQQQEQAKKSEYFVQKTNELFSNEFKGFDFNIGDKPVAYSPESPDQLKTKQMDVSSFLGSFVDEKGYIKDAKAFHKAIAVARNPDGFAKYFYEQGKAEAIGDITKSSKNIQMGVQNAPQNIERGGFKVTAIDTDHGNRLRFKN